jgi:hypothetical protein
MYDDYVWRSWVMITCTYEDYVWRSRVMITCTYEDYVWRSHVTLTFNNRMWRSRLTITCDDYSWRSDANIMCDAHMWRSAKKTVRNVLMNICQFFHCIFLFTAAQVAFFVAMKLRTGFFFSFVNSVQIHLPRKSFLWSKNVIDEFWFDSECKKSTGGCRGRGRPQPVNCNLKNVQLCMWSRVARWFVFKPKIPIWVNFGGSCYEKSWFILWPFGLFYGHWKYFMAIWYIFGYLVHIFLVICYIFRPFGILDQEKAGNPDVTFVRFMLQCVLIEDSSTKNLRQSVQLIFCGRWIRQTSICELADSTTIFPHEIIKYIIIKRGAHVRTSFSFCYYVHYHIHIITRNKELFADLYANTQMDVASLNRVFNHFICLYFLRPFIK